MKVFNTRYALSAGIYEVDVVESSNVDRGNRLLCTREGLKFPFSLGPSDYSDSMEGARAQAEKKRAAKIKSLTAQIKKLKALKF